MYFCRDPRREKKVLEYFQIILNDIIVKIAPRIELTYILSQEDNFFYFTTVSLKSNFFLVLSKILPSLFFLITFKATTRLLFSRVLSLYFHHFCLQVFLLLQSIPSKEFVPVFLEGAKQINTLYFIPNLFITLYIGILLKRLIYFLRLDGKALIIFFRFTLMPHIPYQLMNSLCLWNIIILKRNVVQIMNQFCQLFSWLFEYRHRQILLWIQLYWNRLVIQRILNCWVIYQPNIKLKIDVLSFSQLVQLIQYQMSRHFKTNLKHWLCKVYNLGKKPKKTMCDIAKKMTHIETKQAKNITEERIVDSLLESFQHLKGANAKVEEGMALIDKFINEYELTINEKLRENISQHIQKYLAGGQQNTRNYQQAVSNVWNSNTQTYDCICPKTTKDLQFSELKQMCYRCGRICHLNCLWGKDHKQQLYECPMCFLLNCIPNKEVKKMLFAGFLRQMKKDKIQYKINFAIQNSLSEEQLIQVRCVRLCKENKYELTWPASCNLALNSKKIIDFRPLNLNCSLKKRADDEINLQKRLLSNHNTLIIQQRHQYQEGYRPAVCQNHFLVILKVKTVSSLELQKRLMNQKLGAQESKDVLSSHFGRGIQECVTIDKIKVALKCQLYNSKIKVPVRSKHCTSHYQPFDLKGFLLANINVRSSTKRWKCPICKQRAHHLVVDSYLLNFIINTPNISEIEFDRSGKGTIIEQQDQSDQEQQKGYQIIQCENEQGMVNESQRGKGVSTNQFIQYIQIQSQDNEQPIEESSNKRGFLQRKIENQSGQMKAKQPNKKLKNDSIVINQKNPFHFLNVKQSLQEEKHQESQDSIKSISNIGSFESKYSPNQQYSFKPQKIRKQRRQKVVQEPQDSNKFDKMIKTLIPSPAISTVIPQAIRILQKKMPDVPKKIPINIELIELSEQQDKEPIQVRNAKKLQYHKQQLLKQKKLLTNTFGKVANFQITPSDQQIFLNICDKFLNSAIKNI